MRKRTIALLTLLAVWSAIAVAVDFNRDGGWSRIFWDVDVVTAPVDTFPTDADTFVVTNASTTKLDLDSLSWSTGQASRTAKITFLHFTTTAALRDTVRYSSRQSIAGPKDTIIVPTLSAACANGDSIMVQWYSDNVGVDTVIQTRKDIPVFARNAFLARTTTLSNVDSTGVTFVIQTRVGDSGTWATVATMGMMTETDSSLAFADTLSASNLFIGDQIRTLRIFADSVGGTVRRTSVSTEVWWRGIR